ncbi:hypothetical protein V1283_007396 [Bradyrhizobium sp. AZCC 2262]|uniref:hypothetical protein n=1 Tax=Bradyrhizobium sp. AZCC 2262 TaxID=3117022 RepID=UPI002FF4151E
MSKQGSDPKGDRDALERAMMEVGPFRTAHLPHLLQLCPCKRCVENLIVETAVKFNARERLIEGAPRKKTVIENLRRVSEAAGSLAEALVGLDNHSREYLGVLDELDQIGPIVNAYEAAAASMLPRPESEQEPASDGRFVETLLALEHYVSMRLRRFPGYEAEAVVDKGGNTNVAKQMLGPSAAYLVHGCWIVFENSRPGQATASENGAFVRFVNAVHEYATGDIEENSTLLNWIKRLAKPLRRHDQLLGKLGALEAELEDLEAQGAISHSSARMLELKTKIESAKHEVVDALLATLSLPKVKQNTAPTSRRSEA